MKRSPELAPLSRDHHVALDRALRLRRAGPEDVASAVAAFLAFFLTDGERHFAQEEDVLLPVLPATAQNARRRLTAEHAEIRRRAAVVGKDPRPEPARELGELLSAHIRFEERELFPLLEDSLPADQLARVGSALAASMRHPAS